MSDCHICGRDTKNEPMCDCASTMMDLCIQRDTLKEALKAVMEDCSMSMAPDVMDLCREALGDA